MTASYFIASGLVGFSSSTLRVKLVRVAGPYDAQVVTADLRDAGTNLMLYQSQLKPEVACADVRHSDAIVWMPA